MILPREERPTLKGHFSPSPSQVAAATAAMETTASTLRTTLRRRRRIPPPTNSRANSRHRSSKEKPWFGEDAVSVSLLLPQQNELQFECHSLPPTPSPASPSFSIEKERGYHIHVLHYHLALQKLPKAESVNYNTNNITIIGVCSVILRCRQSFNLFL